MQDFGHELARRLSATQRSLEANRAEPLDGTLHTIRRKRAVRHGATAAVAVVAVALLATTGTAALRELRSEAPVAPIAPTPTASPQVDAYVSISADGPNPTAPSSGIACGDPAPTAATLVDGLKLDVVLDPPSADAIAGGYLEGETHITSAAASIVPAFSLEPEVVVVRDGVVVALNSSGGLSNPVRLGAGHNLLVNDLLVGPWNACADDSEEHYLDPGSYEFYVVSTVANSPKLAAVAQAPDPTGLGFGVWFAEDPLLEPTDWECTHSVSWEEVPNAGSSAVACLPAQDPRIRWDAATRSVTLPYDPSVVSEVVSTQLVAGPFAYEVPAGVGSSLQQPEFTGDACGALIPWDEDAHSATVNTRPLYDLLRAGAGTGEALVWTTFGRGGIEARTAQVLAPLRGRAVIIEQVEVTDDAGAVTNVQYPVVGHATVTVNGGDQIELNRATGPARVDVDIADVTWCDGESSDGLDRFALTMTVYPDELVGAQADSLKLRFYPLG